MRTINLSTSETDKLRYEMFCQHLPTVRRRIQAVYLKALQGDSNKEIGRILGVSRNSVARWCKRYTENGLKALCEVKYHQRESALEPFAAIIKSSFEEQPPAIIAEGIARIETLTGLKPKPTAMRNFMRRHKFRYRKLGHIPAKADAKKQREWIEETAETIIKQAINKECHLLYMDAAHFVLGAFICAVWCTVRKFIHSAAGRNRINVLGAVNAVTKQITTVYNTTYINANTIVDFLHDLKKIYHDLPVYIVLDNARYQHCQLVKDTAKSLSVTLLFLPPYSPNLNIIERLWKFAKKKILYGKYFDTVPKFHSAITNFFGSINAEYQSELNSLLSLKFQFFDNQNALNYAA